MRRTPLLALAGAVLVVSVGLVTGPVSAVTEVLATARISLATDGSQSNGGSFDPAISDDGTIVAFDSEASGLVAGDSNDATDVFRHDTTTGVTTRVSVASSGSQADDESYGATISADGLAIAYYSFATNLVTDDTNAASDIFLRNVTAGTTSRLSVASDGTQGDLGSFEPSISDDGTIVAFVSDATNLVTGDANGFADIFVHDVTTGATSRVSMAFDGSEADGNSFAPEISGDGSVVTFYSVATNLVTGDTNGTDDAFVYDMATGVTTRISTAGDGTEGNGGSLFPVPSDDGTIISYYSFASNLVQGDTNGVPDVFVVDTTTGVVTKVSEASDGTASDGHSYFPAISGDGSTVAFYSLATNLVAGDSNAASDVFVHDLASGDTTRISVASDGSQADSDSYFPSMSDDGSSISYDSDGTNLVAGDTNIATDVFLTTTSTTPPPTTTTMPTTTTTMPATTTTMPTTTTTMPTTTTTMPTTTTTMPTTTTTTMPTPPPTIPPPDPDYNPFDDDDNSVFESDIEWLALSGITSGCGDRLFCPGDNVSRAQMAAFLVRALDLPAASRDYFVDDNNSVFQDDINRLAESGITSGCTTINYCPGDSVTRAQMAAFLVRAFGYTDDGGGNLFSDDDKSVFESDIDKLATAGVTLGCNPPDNDEYCPSADVTRAQMAAFLRRALEQ